MIDDHRIYVSSQTASSALISVAMGSLMFFATYRSQIVIPVWDSSGLVIDCLPQGFMVGFMSALLPSLKTRRAIAKGAVSPLPLSNFGLLPQPLILRAIILGLLGMSGLISMAAALASAFDVSEISFAYAFALKALGSSILTLIITPIAVRAVLHSRPTRAEER